MKRRATLLDKRFKLPVCGARFGWTFIIGTLFPTPTPHLLPGVRPRTHVFWRALAVVPIVGDALTPALGYVFVVHQARKAKYVLFFSIHVMISPFFT